jgi:hypothetical protein
MATIEISQAMTTKATFLAGIKPCDVIMHKVYFGSNFNLLFLFMYFCMIICFKTLENKTSIEPEKISGKTYST